MICPSCRGDNIPAVDTGRGQVWLEAERHTGCPGGTWCDCQHQPASQPGPMTIDELRESDYPVSPLMGLLLGLPADSPRVQAPCVLVQIP